MLYGYPMEATAENWLHECLCEMLNTIHESHNRNTEPPTWPEILPLAYRERLRRRTGLRDRLSGYSNAVKRLSLRNRNKVLDCLSSQNNIAFLLSASSECESLADLPKSIQKPVTTLFEFAFELLTDLGIRDRQYGIIYSTARQKACPFCGCEYFDAPGAPREDMDHYLAKSIYPFAATNLMNLVPMGAKCNERYKLTQDILRDRRGNRRRSFNPYAHEEVKISLDNSQPFDGPDGCSPQWQIDFEPDSPECVTWDNVFCIRERYSRDVLNCSNYFQWLGSFSQWFKLRINIAAPSDRELLDSLNQYLQDLRAMDQSGRDFLRGSVFQMLYRHCTAGNLRLLAFMRDLVSGEVASARA